MPTSERDPRQDPQIGDVLVRGNWRRIVTGIGNNVRGYQVQYTRIYAKTGHSERRTCDTHEGWWRWAKTAEVTTLVVEVQKENLAKVQEAIMAAGGKVLLS